MRVSDFLRLPVARVSAIETKAFRADWIPFDPVDPTVAPTLYNIIQVSAPPRGAGPSQVQIQIGDSPAFVVDAETLINAITATYLRRLVQERQVYR